jgi:hypothetical protein
MMMSQLPCILIAQLTWIEALANYRALAFVISGVFSGFQVVSSVWRVKGGTNDENKMKNLRLFVSR